MCPVFIDSLSNGSVLFRQPGISNEINEMWQQKQYRQQLQPSREQMHGGMMGLSLPQQQQVCLALS